MDNIDIMSMKQFETFKYVTQLQANGSNVHRINSLLGLGVMCMCIETIQCNEFDYEFKLKSLNSYKEAL